MNISQANFSTWLNNRSSPAVSASVANASRRLLMEVKNNNKFYFKLSILNFLFFSFFSRTHLSL